MKLRRRGVNAESTPFNTDMMMDRSMNRALTRSALPTLTDIALIFILKCLDPLLEFNIFLYQFGQAVVDVGQLVVSVEYPAVAVSRQPVLIDSCRHPIYGIYIIRHGEVEEQEAQPEEEIPEEVQLEEELPVTEEIEEVPEIIETIPEEAEETAADATVYVQYIVQEGDTLAKISRDHYGTDEKVSEICNLNDITNGDYIQAGEIILLP